MITPGHFKLYDSAAPPLPAGDYELVGNQELQGDSIPATATEEHRSRIRVRSPRYRLPPDQILSMWPAANEEGAFQSRLPQIVLRRRTLPWERRPGNLEDQRTPWLALVVIAEGEGFLSPEVPVADCVTDGVTLSGPADAATGVYLSVTRTVVDRVFPTAEDLPLLTHVREVDIADTELASGDDDGFLAVVLTNRMPQFDERTCTPVRYTACLINLEDQLDVLPPPDPPVVVYLADGPVQDLHVISAEITEYAEDAPALADDGESTVDAIRRDHLRLRSTDLRAGPTTSAEATWRSTVDRIAETAITVEDAQVGSAVRTAMRDGFTFPIDEVADRIDEPTYRFPVLAHWSFTCTGSGGFETLMQHLDVGLLGTVAPDRAERRRLDCLPDTPAVGPPPPPKARPAARFTETGHVGLAHQSRGGQPLQAWYRGPLGPHVTRRSGDLAHVSDQLRRVTPTGVEDLSYAAAFEIGRLLALSQPSVVAALMRWRRERFGAAKAAARARIGAGRPRLWRDLDDDLTLDLGHLLSDAFVRNAAIDPERYLAPGRPLVDPGRPLPIDRPLTEVLRAGLGIPADRIEPLLGQPFAGAVLDDLELTDRSTGRFTGPHGTALRGSLRRRVVATAERDIATPPGQEDR